jgi:hypothetical protein
MDPYAHDIESIWEQNVITAISHIADEAYQRRSWFGIGPEVSSPTEIISVLFDDYQFDEYVRLKARSADRSLTDVLLDLQARLDELEVDDALAAQLLVSDEWVSIRKLARRAADMLLVQERPH